MSTYSDEVMQGAEAVRVAAAKVQAKADYEAAFAHGREPRDDVLYTMTNHLPIVDVKNSESPQAYIEQDLYANYYNWVPDSFRPFTDLPDPKTSADMAASLESICGPPGSGTDLSGGYLGDKALGHCEDIKDNVIGWRGYAAEAFRNDFVNDLSTLVDEQAAIGQILCGTIRANEGLLRSARLDVKVIASEAVTAIEATADSGGEDVALFLTILSAVATIAAGIATIPIGGEALPPAVAAAYTILAGAAAAGTTTATELASGSSPAPLDADTVDGVLDNVAAALDTVMSNITNSENDMGDKLNEIIEQVSSNMAAYIPRRPTALINSDNPTGGFQPPIR